MVHTSKRRRRHRRHHKTGQPIRTEKKQAVAYTHPVPQPVQQDLPFELAGGDEVVAVAQAEPDAETLLYREARAAADAGDDHKAVSLYQDLLTRNFNHVAARNHLTAILDRIERANGAKDGNDSSHDQPALSIDVLISRSTIFRSLGRYREAERELREALQMDSSHSGAHCSLGVLTSRRGLWSDAAGHLRRAIELDPGHAGAYYHLGEALNQLDDLQGALQAFQKSAELNPNDPKTVYGLGIVLDRLNRPLDAAQMYRRSREIGGR